MNITEMTDRKFRTSMQKKYPGLDLDAKVIMSTGKLMHMLYIQGELTEEAKKKENLKTEK